MSDIHPPQVFDAGILLAPCLAIAAGELAARGWRTAGQQEA